MKTEEELKQKIDDLICLQWRSKTMRNHVWNKIDEYTQQVSRDKERKTAINFCIHLLRQFKDSGVRITIVKRNTITEDFDIWIKNQQQ